MDAPTMPGFEVRYPHPTTGAEVFGVDLSAPLAPETTAALDRLLAERGVLVFHGQKLDPQGFARAISNFGELMPQQLSQFSLDGDPLVGFISNADVDKASGRKLVRGEQYHTDHSNFREPPKATALYGVDIPTDGGDTQFSNVQAAYEELPADLKAKLDGARSLHAYQSSRSPRLMATPTPEERARMPETVQPVVTRHPLTGRKGLYLNTGRMEGIDGMERDEADALLAVLMERATDRKHEYRHKWQAGDLVIWDNRTVLHKANGDVPEGQRRFLYRAMVKGTPLQ
ncbi:MAG TPA: TauD/TfdA family dioxygenase [Falsiroseomonas sp.]|jgi:taurine dioxygenase|nr:TauD/TfdA family dioxygenase [Falsiroseomonas sp.]